MSNKPKPITSEQHKLEDDSVSMEHLSVDGKGKKQLMRIIKQINSNDDSWSAWDRGWDR